MNNQVAKTPEGEKTLEERIAHLEAGFEKLDEVLTAFNNAKGAFATLEWMGKTSKVITPLFLLVGVLSFDIKKALENVAHFLGLK